MAGWIGFIVGPIVAHIFNFGLTIYKLFWLISRYKFAKFPGAFFLYPQTQMDEFLLGFMCFELFSVCVN